jgi:cell division protein FtsB
MSKKKSKGFSIPEQYKPYIFNRYALTIIGFLVWMTFFDQNDFIIQHNYRQKLNALNKEKQYYTDEIQKNKANMENLFTNNRNLEKFAREQYYMKRPNEDVFVFVDEHNRPITL